MRGEQLSVRLGKSSPHLSLYSENVSRALWLDWSASLFALSARTMPLSTGADRYEGNPAHPHFVKLLAMVGKLTS